MMKLIGNYKLGRRGRFLTLQVVPCCHCRGPVVVPEPAGVRRPVGGRGRRCGGGRGGDDGASGGRGWSGDVAAALAPVPGGCLLLF